MASEKQARLLARLSRVGFATKGLVYLVIGGLAVVAALGEGGRLTSSHGAVRAVGEQPFGRVLLLVIAGGLAAYAAWAIAEAILNVRGKRGAAGVAGRVGVAARGVIHAALAWFALQLTRGSAGDGGGVRGWVARGMAQPYGRAIVGAVGVGFAGYGLYQLYCALVARLEHEPDRDAAPAEARRWLVNLGRFGLAARGVVFGVIGYHLVRAALDARPSESRDTGGALREVAALPFGDALLLVVAAGLAAYGIYMVACAATSRTMA